MRWRERLITAGVALFVGVLIANAILHDLQEDRAASDEIVPICASRSEVITTRLSGLQPVAAFNHQGVTLELWQGSNPAGPFDVVWNENVDSDHAWSCVVVLGIDWSRPGFVY